MLLFQVCSGYLGTAEVTLRLPQRVQRVLGIRWEYAARLGSLRDDSRGGGQTRSSSRGPAKETKDLP